MTVSKVKGSRGRKVCPECQQSAGVRTQECKKCGHKFYAVAPFSQHIQAAARFIESIGGIAAAQKALNDLAELLRQVTPTTEAPTEERHVEDKSCVGALKPKKR